MGQQEATPQATAAPQRRASLQTFSVLRHRDYRLLWFGTLFSTSGLWIQQLSIGWLTYDVTGSAFLLGMVNGLRSLPLLVLAPFGGVAADRTDRKRLLLFTQLFLMALTAVFATVILVGQARVWNIVVFTLLTGVAWAFNMPVRQSIVPNVVPREDLPTAIALNSVGLNITRIVGPSIGGLLIAGVGISGNFYLQSLAYVGVATMVWLANIPPVKGRSRETSVGRNLVEGARYVWHHPVLRAQMALALIPVLIAMPYISLMPIFAKDVLRVGPEGFGAMMAAPGVGALVGTLTIAALGNVQRRGLILFVSLFALGLSISLFSQSQSFALSLVLLALSGGFQMTYWTTNQTLIHVTTRDEFRGRVMGIYMLDQGLQPLGSLFAGAMAEVVGAPLTLLGMGGAVVLLSLVAFLALPAMREA